MYKKEGSSYLKGIALSQIFLLLGMLFSIGIISSEIKITSGNPLTSPSGSSSQSLKVGELISDGDGFKFKSSPQGKIWANAEGEVYSSTEGEYLGNLDKKGRLFTPGNELTSSVSNYPGYDGVSDPLTKGNILVNSPIAGHLVQGLLWSTIAVGAIQIIGGLAGFDKELSNALSISVFAGIMGGQFVKGLVVKQAAGQQTATTLGGKLTAGQAGFASGLLIAAAIFILTYSKEKKQMVRFECLPWEPPLGGAACEECNKDPFRPCSEYRCKSLGQACQLLNAGTGREQCAWVSKNDVSSPTITPWNEPLQPKEAKYVPDTSVRPPALGSKIIMGGSGCLPAFTALQFGFITNEPAQCKVDYNHTQKFDDMQFYVGGDNYYRYNHTQSMRLPGPDSADSSIRPLLNNDGSFSLYTRCRDANGNENVDEYSFSFCVEQGPDTTPPRIEKTSITSGSPVQYNVDKVPIEIYTNEPAECKWSTQSKPFADMENTLRCATATYQVNADLLYTCAGNLTGIKNKEENIFYFRCKDQPGKAENERNVMVQSHELKLLGSQQLTIDSVKPNGTISGSTSTVKTLLEIETSNGAEEGKSVCSFSPTGTLNSYVTMFETNNYLHKQELNLVNGTYTYYFRCVDAGGNAASANTTFSIAIDKSAPQVTRVYRDQALKVVTDEDAECRYSLTTCNFNIADGIRMEYMNIERIP